MKTDLCQSCDHCWVFQICWHTQCSTFTTSSFRIWNSSTGIPSPPLALLLPFFGVGMKTDLCQSCGHCWVFQICWHTQCSTFTTSSFRIGNSSTGIPPLPLALFIVMLPKAHLTSRSRMSGSRWVITPSWLSESWRSFLYSYVYSCHIFLPDILLISSASVRSIPFLSFIEPMFAWKVPWYL